MSHASNIVRSFISIFHELFFLQFPFNIPNQNSLPSRSWILFELLHFSQSWILQRFKINNRKGFYNFFNKLTSIWFLRLSKETKIIAMIFRFLIYGTTRAFWKLHLFHRRINYRQIVKLLPRSQEKPPFRYTVPFTGPKLIEINQIK